MSTFGAVMVVVLLGGGAEGLIAQRRQGARQGVVVRSQADLEATRTFLESSIGDQAPDSTTEKQKVSGTRKRMRLEERDLIERLGVLTNELVPETTASMWKLWFHEYGHANAEKLREIDELLKAGPEHWEKAAGEYSSLTLEFPSWAEPTNRLATLRYYEGRYDDSVHLCEKVLRLKPHHFGAASGIVMCHRKRGDVSNAIMWSHFLLPGDPSTRADWARKRLGEFDDANDDAPPS